MRWDLEATAMYGSLAAVAAWGARALFHGRIVQPVRARPAFQRRNYCPVLTSDKRSFCPLYQSSTHRLRQRAYPFARSVFRRVHPASADNST